MSLDKLEYIYRGDSFSVVCMPGETKPALVLGAEAVSRLLPVWRAAWARAEALHPGLLPDAMADLCATLERMLRVYERESVEWWAKQPPPPELAQALEEIEAARKLFEGFDFDPDDGPRRA